MVQDNDACLSLMFHCSNGASSSCHRVGPSNTICVEGPNAHCGAKADCAVFTGMHWTVTGALCERGEFDRPCRVFFADDTRVVEMPGSPFKQFQLIQESAFGDRALVARLDFSYQQWRCIETGIRWPKLLVQPVEPTQSG